MIQITDREVSQADDGQWYGRWTTDDGTEYHGTADHFTAGFATPEAAEAAIPAQ